MAVVSTILITTETANRIINTRLPLSSLLSSQSHDGRLIVFITNTTHTHTYIMQQLDKYMHIAITAKKYLHNTLRLVEPMALLQFLQELNLSKLLLHVTKP